VVELEAISEANAMALKATRLAALQDTPTAFGSTYARESVLTDAQWQERARKWNDGPSVAFLARDGDAYCGIAAGVVDDSDHCRAYLVSMWVAPSHRERGVGRLLVTAVWNWACARKFRELVLEVTDINATAIAFYRRLGFTATGRTRPYDNDPALTELEMTRLIEAAT
jgi:ribosomal protein S18 acetylase RimI-like enzyme